MSGSAFVDSLMVHQAVGLQPGPRFMVLGAVHGNETCGTAAIRRIIHELQSEALHIERGTLTLVPIANPLAFKLKRRHGDRNLNRNMRITDDPQDFEDRVSNALYPMLAQHDVLLDLHSFHVPGKPFALIGPPDNAGDTEPFAKSGEEESLALRLGVQRFVEGWLSTYAQGVRDRQARGIEANVDYGVGTTESMRRLGGVAVTLECGQHEDVNAPQVAYDAIRRSLAHLGMVPGAAPEVVGQMETIRLYRVVDRLHEQDHFRGTWRSFERVSEGEVIACRHDGGELKADRDGWIVFPNPAAQVNEEWFYLAEASSRLAGKYRL